MASFRDFRSLPCDDLETRQVTDAPVNDAEELALDDATTNANDPATLLRIISRLAPAHVAERWLSMVREVPAGERLPAELIAEKAPELMAAHLRGFTRLLVEDRVPTEHEMEGIRQAALEWTGRGVSVEAIIHGVLLGATVSLQIASETAAPPEQGAIVFMTERMMSSLKAYAVALTPLRSDSRAQLVEDEERRGRRLVEQLSAGGEISREASELAAQAGFELAAAYRPLVAALPGAGAQAQFELASQLRAAGAAAYSDGLRALGLLPAWPDRKLDLSQEAVAAVGKPTRRGSLAGALADLTLLVDVGCRFGVAGLMAADEFPLQRLLLRSPRLAGLIEDRVLEPLAATGTGLIETLEAMIANSMKRTAAAKALNLHPGTVDYRMHRVRELTGLDMSQPRDLALAVLALERRALRRR